METHTTQLSNTIVVSNDQMSICMATQDGFPLGYEVFDGNRGDVTTIEEIVQWMEGKYGRAHRVSVMDRGLLRPNLGAINLDATRIATNRKGPGFISRG